MIDFSGFIRPGIATMQPYKPILPFEVLSAKLGKRPDQIVKLDANESPYGMSPRAREAVATLSFPHIYPDPEARELRAELEGFTGVPMARLLAGAGADELIDLVLRVVLRPGDVVINCPPSFGMYPFSTSVNGGRLVNVWRDDGFGVDPAGIEAIVAQEPNAKALFLCSPNNPDGSVVDEATLRRLLALPVLVILDEAYVEFSDHSRIQWVMDYPNLVVLRTFSKWAGLAGLRVGYGAFPEWLLPQLWKIKQPYNVNVAGEKAAVASLQDRAWLEAKVTEMVAERERLTEALATVDYLCPYPSRSNFVLCRVSGRDAKQLKLALEQMGILVRYFAKPGLENCIRVSVGRREDTDRLMAALCRTIC